MQRYITPPEAARRLEISERTIRRWLKKKLIPARRHPSGHWWIPESWIQENLAEVPASGDEQAEAAKEAETPVADSRHDLQQPSIQKTTRADVVYDPEFNQEN